MTTPLATTDLPGLKLLHRGKVRDIYDLGEHLLLVVTDRVSAYDVVLSPPSPTRGGSSRPCRGSGSRPCATWSRTT